MQKTFFITGIDTDIGKTIATGILAKSCLCLGMKVITQKMVQTGCREQSEDILRHRQLMNIALQDADRNGLTCPYVFPVPCSPHLAARLAGAKIVPEVIAEATDKLEQEYETVFIEGAGGLLVPLTEDFTVLDYLEKYDLPLIVVTSPRLGSINHTLAILELARSRKVNVSGIIYNLKDHQDQRIVDDSKMIFGQYMRKHNFGGPILELPKDPGANNFIFTEQHLSTLLKQQ